MDFNDTIAALEEVADDIVNSPIMESLVNKLPDDIERDIDPNDVVLYVHSEILNIISAPKVSEMLDEARNSADDGDFDAAQYGYEAIMNDCEIHYTVKDELPSGTVVLSVA